MITDLILSNFTQIHRKTGRSWSKATTLKGRTSFDKGFREK